MILNIADIAIIALYLGMILLIGIYSKSREESVDSYFLGSKNIHWFYIMLSIVATETSSLTFLGVPGISYAGNFNFLQLAFGFILGRIIVSAYILPVYMSGNNTSVYQWIGKRFGSNTRKSMSGVFLITRILSDGVRLYAVSIPVALVFNTWFAGSLDETQTGILAVVVISLVTIVYSSLGGFKSVVITDTIQFFLYMTGGSLALYFLFLNLPAGVMQLHAASFAEKSEIFSFTTTSFFTTPYYFINALVGGIFISIGSHGVDQMIAQRSLACHTTKDAQKALVVSGFVILFQFAMFLFIGFLLFVFYQGQSIPSDAVFSRFILEKIPSPFTGLVVAAILASAMSTFSSSINALSLSVVIDWSEKLGGGRKDFVKSQLISIFWGIMLCLSALLPFFLDAAYKEGVVVTGLKIASVTLGPMIGMFILARLKSDIPELIPPLSLVFSLAGAILLTLYLAFATPIAFTLLIPAGMTVFLLLVLLLTVAFRKFRI